VLEVADILRAAGAVTGRLRGRVLAPAELKVARAIVRCRTAAMGGHLKECDACGRRRYSYHSCRNRHCPKCRNEDSSAWLEAQEKRLLTSGYYLVTFTLPQELRPLARAEPRKVYAILMTAAAQSLLKLTRDPRHLGATPGIVGVLHTWTRAMLFHPHVHFLVTAGGLSRDRSRWVAPTSRRFLVPGYVVSPIFRAKVRDALKAKGLLDRVAAGAWQRKWVVHLKHAGKGEKVLAYLARYVLRVAINNSRLVNFADGKVSFRYRDNRSGVVKRCTITAEEFAARFLEHVLPRGFTKVRYYGLLSPSRAKDLEVARALLPSAPKPKPAATSAEPASSLDDTDEPCPYCRVGHLRIIQELLPERGPP
jgi:hypothetical protein